MLLSVSGVSGADWTDTDGGDWHNDANWSGSAPDGQDAAADFTSDIGSDIDVNLDAPATVGSILFADGGDAGSGYNSFRVTGSNILSMDVSSGNAVVKASVGTGNEVATSLSMGGDELFVDPVAGAKVTFSGNITGTGGLDTSNDGGTFEFLGDNSGWSGRVDVTTNGGRLGLGSNTALGTGLLNIRNNATLYAVGGDQVLSNQLGFASTQTVLFDGANGNDLTFTGDGSIGSLVPGGGAGTLSFTGDLNLSTRIDANGSGSRVNFTGNNSGSIGQIREGAVIGIGHDNALGSGTGDIRTVFDPVFMAMNGARTISQNFKLAVSDFNVTGADDLTVTGTVFEEAGRSGGLNKDGSGTLTLKGNNSYTETTTINSGMLVAAHDSALGSGSVAVNTGGTLAVTSGVTVANAVGWADGTTIAGSGTYDRGSAWNLPENFTIAPGFSPGTLAINAGAGNLVTLQETTDLMMELASDSNFDSIAITGDAAVAGELYLDLLGDYAPGLGQTFDLLTADSITDNGLSLAGPYAGDFTWEIVPGDSEILQVISQVPEPGAGVLLFLGLILMSGLRRHM